jgi:hypothetical protein
VWIVEREGRERGVGREIVIVVGSREEKLSVVVVVVVVVVLGVCERVFDMVSR